MSAQPHIFNAINVSIVTVRFHREKIIPTLSVREACVEDNEDLLPIFDAQSEVLSEQYGEFFLAEMIEMQDDKNKALVSLNEDDRASGLMGVSSDVELTMLQNCFQLDAFDYLVKLPQVSHAVKKN